MVIWLTGLSGAGKSTIGRGVYDRLKQLGHRCELLDGDDLRQSICRDLGFSREDREENVLRAAWLASLLASHDILVIAALISPFRAQREELRRTIPYFIEVSVDAPLKTCEERDPKSLYARARLGQIKDFTGIDSQYEAPLAADCHCRTDVESEGDSVMKVLNVILERLA